MTQPAPSTRSSTVRREGFALLELLAATWLAVAQPVLDAFQRSAETFVFRRASSVEVVIFTVVVTFGPAVVLYLVEVGAGLVHAALRRWVHRAAIGAALAVFAVEVALRSTHLSPLLYWVLAVVVGVLAVVALARLRAAEVFLRFLAVAPFAFAVLFLLSSPVSQVAFADSPITADGVTVGRPTDIVMVVFDELPTASLLDGSGGIDADLFPNFARLAADADWYLNQSSVSPTTPEAVPALLSGRYPQAIDEPPTAAAHPDNLFTLLAGAYDMNVWEQATQLCPADVCPEAGTADRTGLAALLGDARSVWTDLLTVRAAGDGDEPFKVRQSDPAAPARFEEFVASLEPAAGPRLDFLHVLLPHQPWRHLPSGKRHNGEFLAEGLDERYRWREPFFAAAARQRHLLQLQRTDALLGTLLDRLHELDRYDGSLIVVTADHGVSFLDGEPIRGVSVGNEEQTMWTPLLIKRPHRPSGAGTVSRVPIESVDLLPTLAAELGIDLPFETDGAPVDDGDGGADDAGRAEDAEGDDDLRRTYRWTGFSDIAPFPGEDYAFVDGKGALDRLLATAPWPSLRDDDLRLYAFGRHGDLVGEPIDRFEVGDAAPFAGELADPDETLDGDEDRLDRDAVDLDGEVLPVYVRGLVETREPVDLLVAVNGVAAGWCPAFVDSKQASGTQSFFVLTPEQLLVDGANEVEVFAIERSGDEVVLHPVATRGR